MYLQDILGNDYRHWEFKESIFINAPTGMGKTTFVIEKLVPLAMESGQEVLFLSNRALLRDQVKIKIAEKQNVPTDDSEWMEAAEEFEGLTIMTYQKLQKLWKKEIPFFLISKIKERYKYIVYDEAHYILEDSAFNPEILYLLEFIKQCREIQIFLSATMEGIPEFICNLKYGENILRNQYDNTLIEKNGEKYYLKRIEIETIETTISIINETSQYLRNGYVSLKYPGPMVGERRFIWIYDFPSIKRNFSIRYFKEFDEIIQLINNKSDNNKWLVFVSNKENAKKYKEGIEVSCEVLDADNRNSDKMKEFVSSLIKNEEFECQVLITTAVLDNGINIKDTQVRNLVIDTISKTEFLQMIGRKRIEDDENINLYIPQKDLKYFTSLLNLEVNPCYALLGLKKNELMEKLLEKEDSRKRIRNFFSHDDKLILNPAAEVYIKRKKNFLEDMIIQMKEDEWAFVKMQLGWLEMIEDFHEEYSLTYQNRKRGLNEIQSYLESILENRMDKEEQDIFRNNMNKIFQDHGVAITKNNQTPGKNVLNDFFHENSLPYKIYSISGKRKGHKTVWIVKREESI